MTTKTLDSTVSGLLQDNSSIEYVDSQENPIVTIPNNGLIFGQMHNGIECALCPTAKRACDRAWVSAKNVEVWSRMSTTTLWRWLGKLEKARRIQSFSDMKKIKIDDENGRGHETTLYNLNVLNQLAMVCIDNEKLNDVSCKFSDILSEVETTGSYGTPQISRKDQLYLAIIHSESEEERADALKELAEISKQEVKALTAQRDEAIRTKAQIGSSREAKAMNTASQKSKECKRLETENELLTSENSRLRQDYVENKDFCKQLRAQSLVTYVEKTLRDKCSKALQELSALMEIPRLEWNEWNDKAGKEVPRYAYHKDVCAELKQRIIDNPKYLRRFK